MPHLFHRPLLCAWLLLLGTLAIGQRSVLLFDADGPLPKGFRRPTALPRIQDADREQLALLMRLRRNGHLEASVDSCTSANDTLTCRVHIGPQYKWAALRFDGVPQEYLSRVHARERAFRDRPTSPAQLVRLFEELLVECEERGFPFAVIGLDSLDRDDRTLSAVVRMDPGVRVIVDSVIVRGTAKVSPRFLYQQIGIRPGDPYNESLIGALEARTKEMPFVSQEQKPYVLFGEELTKLYLFLNERKASSINGILGVQPDPLTGRVRFTGDVELRLRNALRRGELIDLNWRSLADRTQDLKLRFDMPFLFNTAFGTDLGLKLFRRDTSFLEVNGRVGITYFLRQGDRLLGFVNSRSNRTLGQNAQFVPGLADLNILTYGLGLRRERYDYARNPRRGYFVEFEGSVGQKESEVPDPDDMTMTSDQRTVQYEVELNAAYHIPWGRRGTIRIATLGGSMINDVLFRNELFRIGGIKSLRGFDDASISASSYVVGTLEVRLLLEENSNAFIFVDQAWWEDLSGQERIWDDPLGLGVGTSFETKAGIFSLTYALGSQFNVPFSFRGGKVHFGFTSLF
ncbi:MAG: BamA/TamA family outer membrane protein [Flavobacteriales bacterium]|nr:BamA/TamA family outer membrane protein [Flavobacteriales bacterium]